MTTNLHLTTAVTALGETHQDIADLLDAGGWVGWPNRNDICPIARYLTDVVPDATYAYVGDREIAIGIPGGELETTTPQAVAMFIALFDEGHYPSLIDPLAEPDDDF